jgi:hypothetical protein
MSDEAISYGVERVLPPWGCEDEIGVPAEFVIETQTQTITGEITLRTRAPFDMIARGIHITALDNSNNPSLSWGMNIRSDRQGDWLYYTDPRGSVVPVAAIAGSAAEPFYWPAPRFWRKGETIIVKLQPDATHTLSFVSIVFDARRLRGAEAERYECLDPRSYGYQAIVSPGITVDSNSITGSYGAEIKENMGIDSLPYDLLMSQKTVLITDPANAGSISVPVVGAIVGTRERYPTFRHEHTLGLVASTRYGGGAGSDGGVLAYRPISAPLPACTWLHQQGSFDFSAAHLRTVSNSPTQVKVFTVLHGQRVPQEGLPGYLGWPALDAPAGMYDPRNGPH